MQAQNNLNNACSNLARLAALKHGKRFTYRKKDNGDFHVG
jgi:hypothetical protein